MGLTISYAMKLRKPSIETAREKVAALHRVALSLPFAEVGEITECEGEQCQFHPGRKDPLGWLQLHAAEVIEYEHSFIAVEAERAIAFNTWPGKGCESAMFGLAIFPETIELHGIDANEGETRVISTNLPPWSWSSFCKTQYASNPEYGGVEHFLKCHGLVIRMLDACRDLEILESVNDEGGYWKGRDWQRLANSVGKYNNLVAAVIGGLDMFFSGASVVESHAPISEYPNFEYLEAQGLQDLIKRDDE